MEQEQLQYTRLPKLPRFAGDGGAEQFVKEVRLLLQLQPMPPASAVTWILGALEGRARQEVLDRTPEEINTPDKLLRLILQKWGEQRDASTLTAAFYRRQQGLGETVDDYSAALKGLFQLANSARPGILADDMLRDAFIQGLQPAALRRDIRAYVRLHADSSYEEVKKEAQRWMREDFSDVAAIAQLAATPPPDWTQLTKDLMAHIDQQVAAVADRFQQPMNQHRWDADTNAVHSPPAPRRPNVGQQQHPLPARRQSSQPQGQSRRGTMTCMWCSRKGHLEDECQSKNRYVAHQNGASQQHPQQLQAEPVRYFPSHTAANRRITVESIELTGECPTLDVAINGCQVAALIDTGSEISTISDSWVSQHLGHLTLDKGFFKLQAVNGAEVPYLGVTTLDVQMFGQFLRNVPFLVVPTPRRQATHTRKREPPVLLGMNVLKRWLPHANQAPQFLASTANRCDLKNVPKTSPVAESFFPASFLIKENNENMTTTRSLLSSTGKQPTTHSPPRPSKRRNKRKQHNPKNLKDKASKWTTVTDKKRGHPISVGDFVYIRNRVTGCNKIQDFWKPDLYSVTARMPGKHLYTIIPLAGGPELTVHREDLLPAEAPLSDLVPKSEILPPDKPSGSDDVMKSTSTVDAETIRQEKKRAHHSHKHVTTDQFSGESECSELAEDLGYVTSYSRAVQQPPQEKPRSSFRAER